MVALELRILEQSSIASLIRQIKALRYNIAQMVGMEFGIAAFSVESCGFFIHRRPAFLGLIGCWPLYAGFSSQFVSCWWPPTDGYHCHSDKPPEPSAWAVRLQRRGS
jgi:hypothetical protein